MDIYGYFIFNTDHGTWLSRDEKTFVKSFYDAANFTNEATVQQVYDRIDANTPDTLILMAASTG